ncbi:hypothetical protein SETIT_7G053600v2 [Setaria italica]|uniref:DUF4220 domain-containing protein n=1 Tax=Setaria italica TaxID=4555 RepID=A0A368RSL0_SETIT|nr:uncharacterized protein LOC101758028 isoform X1 [Setaria italica]RCV33073.1 hypothetical protein SETIT_7G053600v2 [Setaria italica]
MANLSNNVSSRSPICPEYLFSYTANLTASYTDKCNLLTTVPASLIVFILAGLFFNLNLFSGISDVSAILNPKVRLFLSSVLSLFLPVMSYLFSEAKNKGDLPSAGLSLRALLILAWMLLVELLRRKVDEIRMRGYTSTIQRAGRVVWLGSLVFFNINIVAQRALFSMLWILCVTRLLQRLAFTEVEKRSYAHGKNAGLINSYMAQQMLGAHDVDQVIQGEHHELLKRCKYIVMGEEKLVKKVTAYGYELNEVTPRDSIITVGKVWELAESDHLFTTFDQNQHLRRLCLSFALFKLLRRRFEQLPAVMRAEEARDSRNLLLKGLRSSGQSTAEALFQVMNDEVNFLCEYNHSVTPVVLASPFFLLVNYFLILKIVLGFCIMSSLLSGNGNLMFTLQFISHNYAITRLSKVGICLLLSATESPSAFFFILDLFITFILIIILCYEEIWEFFIFILSNWYMVSLLCNYMAKPKWRGSCIFSGSFRFLMLLRSKLRNTNLDFKQFSVLDLCWQPLLALPATLSLKVTTAPVPNKLKQSIMEYMVEHERGTSHNTPLTKEILPDNQENVELFFEDICEELKNMLGSWDYYLSSRRIRVKKIMESIKGEDTTETTGWREVDVETTGQSHQSKVVTSGAKLGKLLMDQANNSPQTVWKVLADVWTELIIYIAASSDKERVKDVLVLGGEFITLLWALIMHTGISPPANDDSRSTS